MPWPGASTYSTNSVSFTSNFSGIKYIAGSGGVTTDRIWGADNDGVIWKLKWDTFSANWIADPTWGSTGRPLSLSLPLSLAYDSEGITFGSNTNVGYFCTERVGSGVSRLTIAQFSTASPVTAGSALPILKEWILTGALPIVASNKGLEGLTFIPNNFLVGGCFKNSAGVLYNPASYPLQVDGGVFFAGLEGNGRVYAFVLNSDMSFVLLASFSSGEYFITDLEFDPKTGYLWTSCDNQCAGVSHVFTITNGSFTMKAKISPPSAVMASQNLEGFTIEPDSRCNTSTNRKYAYWANDDNGNLIKAQIKCGVEAKFLSLPSSGCLS
jgi:hypothetical protein